MLHFVEVSVQLKSWTSLDQARIGLGNTLKCNLDVEGDVDEDPVCVGLDLVGPEEDVGLEVVQRFVDHVLFQNERNLINYDNDQAIFFV